MLRYVIAVEGVENDQVILEGVGQGSFGKYSTVLIENLNLIVLCEVEVFFCDLGWVGSDSVLGWFFVPCQRCSRRLGSYSL